MNNWLNYCNDDCLGCPFNMNEISEQAQNWGCLPPPYEILNIKRNHGYNWECHEGTGKVCGGFVAACRDSNIDYKTGPLLDTTEYLRTGHILEKNTLLSV
jgi:hypothetical protein